MWRRRAPERRRQAYINDRGVCECVKREREGIRNLIVPLEGGIVQWAGGWVGRV